MSFPRGIGLAWLLSMPANFPNVCAVFIALTRARAIRRTPAAGSIPPASGPAMGASGSRVRIFEDGIDRAADRELPTAASIPDSGLAQLSAVRSRIRTAALSAAAAGCYGDVVDAAVGCWASLEVLRWMLDWRSVWNGVYSRYASE